MSAFHYRPDIDGMRAVAVLSVIVFHIDAARLPGGFLGVDIFFVLSGYLITRIISREMQDGTFSFVEFYKRRAKRILPAFVFVLLLVTPVVWYLFLKRDMLEYSKSAAASLMFAANLFFAGKTDYFDVSSSEKPLLHIWSLSVEEQFYFVFPILLLLCIRFFRGKTLWLVSGLIVLSLLAQFLPTFGFESYYMPYIRAYELLIGSLFAFLKPRESGRLVSWVLLLLLAGLMLLPHGLLPGNGYLERLLACTAAGMMILFGQFRIQDKGDKVYRLLASKAAVGIGLISYSLYLWHWVVLAVLRYVYMDVHLPWAVIAAAVVLMFLLAWFSYRFIEQPIRRLKNFSTRKFIIAMEIYLLLLLPFGTYIYTHNANNAEENLLQYDAALKVCKDEIGKIADCKKGEASQAPTVLVAGDSHTGHYNEFIDAVGKSEGWAADVVSGNSCAVAFGFVLPESDKRAERCNRLNRFVEDNYGNYRSIVFAERWSLQIPKPGFTEKFERTLQTLVKNGKQVYVFKDTPPALYPLYRKYRLEQKGIDIDTVAPQRLAERAAADEANRQIEALAAKYPEVRWVDVAQFVPKDFFHQGKPVYHDYDHLNPYGSRFLAERFIGSGQKLIR
ncbi:acyltransferase family protein [Neisseria sp.]|uniref:acyltransferase family protein n=1 Tax=Neisseria sp. TaxID=192066 RepID=UPI0035A1B9EE